MAARVSALLLLLLLLLGLSSFSAGPGPDSERGRMELWRVQTLASQPRYGGCWARALENLDTRCKDLTAESQSRIALRFTHCHLSSSGRDFPSCPEGSEVSRCTGGMDAVAFNTYTEFYTHTHSICHFLQSEAWQSRAENTMYRLTESSAGVAEQLQSTRQMAEDLIEAQSAALQAQQEILTNGEELRVTLRDSTQGLRAVFSELSSVSREQQVALSELFNRVSFLQSFLLMETHSLSSCCYNAAALCAAFLLTSTQRSSRARLVLLGLVCLNFYLERKIFQLVTSSDHPEHQHMVLTCRFLSSGAGGGVRRRAAAAHGVCGRVCPGVCVCAVQRPGAAESAGAAAAQRDAARPAGGAAARREFNRETEEDDRGESASGEEIREQKKKRGGAEEETGGKRTRGGGGGEQHVVVSNHKRLTPVSPLTHRWEL
ncbi:uncharacterized protein LOC108890564 isoform X2 [Lates calcarifer]|uniref:Uncharacterized protein LOC108890564 isoform X2 n=1 Tax=Lates calcarifer TaxID=8187 RepID=A0AAJ7VA18_LATCA|nr:uncharacterized protein LOC108890564 isoform X2 [Lates calcarifer]